MFDSAYELDHRYTRASGRVFLTGVQALVRLPLLQAERDRAAGLRTAGFISGYRGSPLGGYDLALWEARAHLERADVRFSPGVNEDLAATAVWGTQQAMVQPRPTRDGVFAIWYGKGPGVDRSVDAIKHGNYMGTAKHGGVLALCGDDPGAKSSSIAHQSEQALIHCGIPVLHPASVQEYLDLGLAGFAMSRFSGCWVGMKCLTDTVDSGASVEVGPERVRLVAPDFPFPARDHHVTMNNIPLEIERALVQVKLPAAQAFARANAPGPRDARRAAPAARDRDDGQGLPGRAPGARGARARRRARRRARAVRIQGRAGVAARAGGDPRVLPGPRRRARDRGEAADRRGSARAVAVQRRGAAAAARQARRARGALRAERGRAEPELARGAAARLAPAPRAWGAPGSRRGGPSLARAAELARAASQLL